MPRGHKRELLHAIGLSMPLPDVRFTGSIRDVICRQNGVPAGCRVGQEYDPNSAGGPYGMPAGTGGPAACGSEGD